MSTPWREVFWTDADCREVYRIACHESELGEVLDYYRDHTPEGAVCREPVKTLSRTTAKTKFFRRSMVALNEQSELYVNQGMRPASVVGIDEKTGKYLLEYEMPRGSTALRVCGWDKGQYREKSVSSKALSQRWQRLLGEQSQSLLHDTQVEK